MGTAAVVLILAVILVLVVRSMIKDKKSGKSLSCGGDCRHCGGHCSMQDKNEGNKVQR